MGFLIYRDEVPARGEIQMAKRRKKKSTACRTSKGRIKKGCRLTKGGKLVKA